MLSPISSLLVDNVITVCVLFISLFKCTQVTFKCCSIKSQYGLDIGAITHAKFGKEAWFWLSLTARRLKRRIKKKKGGKEKQPGRISFAAGV